MSLSARENSHAIGPLIQDQHTSVSIGRHVKHRAARIGAWIADLSLGNSQLARTGYHAFELPRGAVDFHSRNPFLGRDELAAGQQRKLTRITAAKEIGELAGNSVTTAERAGKLLDEIVPSIHKTSELVQEIAAASSEQSESVTQIGAAMGQLSKATQQNASASEELAATSEELSGQAEQLQQSIAFFNTGTDPQQTRSRQELPALGRKNFAMGRTAMPLIATPTRNSDSGNFKPY